MGRAAPQSAAHDLIQRNQQAGGFAPGHGSATHFSLFCALPPHQ